jgi:hypothetical protein
MSLFLTLTSSVPAAQLISSFVMRSELIFDAVTHDKSRGKSCTIFFHQCSEGTVHSPGVEALQGWQLKTLVSFRITCVCTERYGVRPPWCVLTPENVFESILARRGQHAANSSFPASPSGPTLGRARGRAEFVRRPATRPAGRSTLIHTSWTWGIFFMLLHVSVQYFLYS